MDKRTGYEKSGVVGDIDCSFYRTSSTAVTAGAIALPGDRNYWKCPGASVGLDLSQEVK